MIKVLVLFFCSLNSFSANDLNVVIKVKNFNSDQFLKLALYSDKKSYKNEKPLKTLVCHSKLVNESKCIFEKLLSDTFYGVAGFVDKNLNDKIDTNLVGYPNEKFTFSNKPRLMFSKPSFDKIKFKNKSELQLEFY